MLSHKGHFTLLSTALDRLQMYHLINIDLFMLPYMLPCRLEQSNRPTLGSNSSLQVQRPST